MLHVGGGLEPLSLSSDNALGVFSVDCIIMFSFPHPHFSQVFILPGGCERVGEGRRQDALSKISSDSRSLGLECLRVCKWRF